MTSLRELSLLFLRLGTVAFGGPAAHIAMMRQELVQRRAWLSDERFLDLLSATNLIPGPNSTEMAIHIGYERRRWAGLLVSGLSFILPSALMTTVLGFLYVRYGTRPEANALLYGVRPVMLAIVLQAVIGLAPRAARDDTLRVIALLTFVLAVFGVDELWLLLGAAALMAARQRFRGVQVLAPVTILSVSPHVSLPGLFGVFVKVGSLLFGSGYVLMSLLRGELVEKLGWLTERELLDAIVVGQVTPGPLFTSATFIGYLLREEAGAAVATAGIFLPAFVLVALSGPLIPKLRASPTASSVLDGVNAASIALMAAVLVQMALAAIVDVASALAAVASVALLLRTRLNATWLIVAGAVLGLLWQRA